MNKFQSSPRKHGQILAMAEIKLRRNNFTLRGCAGVAATGGTTRAHNRIPLLADSCTMQHAFGLCSARVLHGARVSQVCDCLTFSLRPFGSGGWVGASRRAGVLFFFLAKPWPTVRSHVVVWGRGGGEPSGAHRDRRAVARETARGPGRYTNTEDE